MVDRGFEGGELDIDWDYLFEKLPDDLNFDFCDPMVAADGHGVSNSPNSVSSLSIGDIEQFLMDDESNDPVVDDQDIASVDELFADVLLELSPGPDRSKDDSGSPESAVEVETEEDEKEKETNKSSGVDVVDVRDDDDNDDPAAKKRKRQMRNRDAAVRSRERKKMYVKDLEMKSKYYEAECKRLGILLQCCLAENQALRLSMHNSKAFDASMSKQESAVLLLESLLLGSLLGFLGIIYLLILPSHLLATLEAGLLENVEWENVAGPRKTRTKVHRVLFHLFMMGKTCKASRSRMKLRLSMIEVGL